MTARETKLFVADIQDQTEIEAQFLVTRKDLAMTRTGKPYLRLTLADKTGTIEARVWENAEPLSQLFERDDFVVARGLAQLYQGQIQLNVQGLEKADETHIELADYLPVSRWGRQELFEQLRVLLSGQIRSRPIRELLLGIFEDPEISERLRIAPAAMTNHHAYLGGLVEHILSMCRLAIRVCEHYHHYYPNFINRDLVIAGCVLHDLAKISELSYSRSFGYTDAGKLLGHLVMGVEVVTHLARRVEDFPVDLEIQLKHLVVSHHERLEYGSPKVPQTLEAVLLHYIDNIDAKMNQLHGILSAHQASTENDWTEKQWSFGRAFYAPVDPTWSEPLPEPPGLAGPGQLELFPELTEVVEEPEDAGTVVECLDLHRARREARSQDENTSPAPDENAEPSATTQPRNLDLFDFPLLPRGKALSD